MSLSLPHQQPGERLDKVRLRTLQAESSHKMVARPAWLHLASLYLKPLEGAREGGSSKFNLVVHARDRTLDPLGRSLENATQAPMSLAMCSLSDYLYGESCI